MLATYLHGPADIRLEDVPDPQILTPTDALVSVVASCVCGSDLWGYRGVLPIEGPVAKGHEFVGVVDEVGAQVCDLKAGDFVIAPFAIADGNCVHCKNGVHPSCVRRGRWGLSDAEGRPVGGGQAERARVPLASSTLVKTDRPRSWEMVRNLLTLSDVLPTGYHAAVCAGVRRGATVVVVGDGAVGLCGIMAARSLGAERIIAMSRRPERQAVAKRFGATDVVRERGAAGAEVVRELTAGVGADCVLECVGTEESVQQAVKCARPGGQIGFVGLPHGGSSVDLSRLFAANLGIRGGAAPVLAYMGRLLPEVLDGTLRPGAVFDMEVPLTRVAEAYAAMDGRSAIKALLRPPATRDGSALGPDIR
jgi:hypothetical protein